MSRCRRVTCWLPLLSEDPGRQTASGCEIRHKGTRIYRPRLTPGLPLRHETTAAYTRWVTPSALVRLPLYNGDDLVVNHHLWRQLGLLEDDVESGPKAVLQYVLSGLVYV